MYTGLRTFILIFFLANTFLSGCHISNRNEKHILILAIDQFGFNKLNCNKDNQSKNKSGLNILCRDSIRFTHAYSTSQNTRPALASILTAKYPHELGVYDNDSTFLSTKEKTISEVAFQNGYETAFFVGAPFVLRNSGLQKGFQFFDDQFLSDRNSLFRFFNETQQAYINWRNKQYKPTFSIIHIPDLFFQNRATVNELGEQRNLSYESQIEELDSLLFKFTQSLKKQNTYDNTMIVLIGLNYPDDDKNKSIDESSEIKQDQIALLIKPAQKPRNTGLEWTYDENVSLVDIGGSLFDFFNEPLPASSISLLNQIENRNIPKTNPRWIVSQTLSSFEDRTDTLSLRKQQFHLILKHGQTQIFNTLIDKQEISPLSLRDSLYKELSQESAPLIQKITDATIQVKKVRKRDEIFSEFELQKLKETYLNDDCLKELLNIETKKKFVNCKDKKILLLNELLNQSSDLTDRQRKKISSIQTELKFLNNSLKINKESGYTQAQPIIELERWFPFLTAINLPYYLKLKPYFTK